MQPLRRSEDLAAQAVGDHHVVADGHAEHGAPSSLVGDRVAQRRQARRRRAAAITVGQLVEAATRRSAATSNAGSRSSSSGERQPVGACVRRPRRAAATAPTWLARTASRPEWNEPPSDSRRPRRRRTSSARAPSPSGASRSSESCSPAEVALVCTTRSRPPGASAGSSEADAERGRDVGARSGSTSTSVTSTPGIPASSRATQQPTMPAPTTATRSPTQRGGVPQRVDGGLDRAGEHGALGRHVVGHHDDGVGRDDVRRLVRVEAEHGAPQQVGGPVLDDADVEVAVLHRAREVALLERRPHHGVLARPAPARGRPAPRCRG